MLIEYLHNPSVKFIGNARRQTTRQHPPIAALCQYVNLFEQFFLFGCVDQRSFLVDLYVVIVRLSHDTDIRTRFFRYPDEVGINAQVLQAILQQLTSPSTQKADGSARSSHALEQAG